MPQPADASKHDGEFPTSTIGLPMASDANASLNQFGETIIWRVDDTTPAASTESLPHVEKLGKYDVVGLLGQEDLGQVVCVIGEAGLGKSRLIREIAEHVVKSGDGQVIEWRASPFFTNTGLYPAVEAFGRMLELDRESSPAGRLDRLVNHLAENAVSDSETVSLFASLLSIPIDGRYPPLALSPMKLMEKTLDAMLHLLRLYSTRSPLLFVVEDLHWIDPTSLQLLGRLLDQGLNDRLLTLLTFRPEFETPWGSRANQTQLALNRLTRAQIEEMMLKRTGLAHIPAEVVHQIVERTEGVPLFIEEYSNLITESGALREVDGRVQLAEGLDLQAIPATLQDLLVSRLNRLGSLHDVAQMGATIGRRFRYELDLGELDEAEADYLESLAVAVRQQAKSYELRTTISLGRLWVRRGQTAKATAALSSVYNWYHRRFRHSRSERGRAIVAGVERVTVVPSLRRRDACRRSDKPTGDERFPHFGI